MAFLSSSLGKGVRRFIKRKHSDAGEAGRALEELRGALYSELQTSEGAKRLQQRFCGPIVAMSFNFVVSIGIILGNKLMAKIAVTPTIVLAEFVLFTKTVSFKKVLALVVVSVGVAVATVTDLEFNLFGACIAIAWIIPSAITKILKSDMQQQGDWTALALMWKTTPITVFFLVAMRPLLDPPGVASFKWDLNNSSAILFSALLGFLLQFSGTLALGATSATSHVVLGQFKTCVILLGGYFLFDSNPGFMSIFGAVTALGGMTIYTSLGLKGSEESHSKAFQKQGFLSLVKEKSTENETEESEMVGTSSVV